jgi:endoglucanase
MVTTVFSRSFRVGMMAALVCAANALAAPLPMTGVNLAGGEFYQPRPGVTAEYGKNYSYPTRQEIEYFAAKGMNVFRYPFLWETLQPRVRGPLDPVDLQRLKESVRYATDRGLIVLLDPHNYARFYKDIVGGPNVSAADFADFWGKLATEFKAEPRVWFGLVNEPHDMPTAQWFEAANAAIAAIRAAGANQLILVPGNSWTGAHSWTTAAGKGNAAAVLSVRDPLDHWIIEVHQYLDADNSGTKRFVVSPTIGSERLKAFVGWCREHRMRAFLGEFAVPVVPQAQEALEDMLASMERDRDVWLGWTWWAAGARWNEYMFTLEPKAGADRPQMAWLRPHLQGAALPKFRVDVDSGTGSGEVEACATCPIEAKPSDGRTFVKWSGDTAWLDDPVAAKTTLRMPFRNVHLEPVYR